MAAQGSKSAWKTSSSVLVFQKGREINQVIELLDHLPISPSVWGHYYKTGIPSWANKLIRISSPFLSLQNPFPFSSSESMLSKFLVSERS